MRMQHLIENIEARSSSQPIFESRTVMSFAVAAGLPRGSMGERISDQEELDNLYLIADTVVRDILPYALKRTKQSGFAAKLDALPVLNSADAIRTAIRRIGVVGSSGEVKFSGDSEKAITDNPQMIQILRKIVEGLTKTYLGARRGKDGDAEAFSMRKIGSEAGSAFGTAVEALSAAIPSSSSTFKKTAKYKIIDGSDRLSKNSATNDSYDESGDYSDAFSQMTGSDLDKLAAKYEDVGSGGGKRSIADIAQEIRSDWQNVNFGAKPYLSAMFSLDSVKDYYGMDRGDMIVRYFLANATSWRGDTAKRIKKELNDLLKGK